MTDEELLESVERHFLVGNAGLTRTQFGEHASRGSCAQCDEIARLTVRDRAAAVNR